MLIAWPIVFGALAALFGVLAFTGTAHGWTVLAEAMFTVFTMAFGASATERGEGARVEAVVWGQPPSAVRWVAQVRARFWVGGPGGWPRFAPAFGR